MSVSASKDHRWPAHRLASDLAKFVHQPKVSIETGSRLSQGVKVASLSLLHRRKVYLVSHIKPRIKDECWPRVANLKVHLVSLACPTWVVKALPIIRTSRHVPTPVHKDLASSLAYRPLEHKYWQRCSLHPKMMIKTVSWTSRVKFRCSRLQ